MTEEIRRTATPAPATYISSTTESIAARNYSRRKKSLETEIFDLYALSSNTFRIECGDTVFTVSVREGWNDDTGIRDVIAEINDTSHGVTRTPRGRGVCAYQFQSVGWHMDLTSLTQVREIINDEYTPENLKAVIRHMLKGDLKDVGDPYSRRVFNNIRYKVLSARRRNDRDALKSI